MNINELKEKPIWQMTGGGFLFLQHNGSQNRKTDFSAVNPNKKYVYGILGIAQLLGYSMPTAYRIKKSGKIDKAITQIGRKIIVDANFGQFVTCF